MTAECALDLASGCDTIQNVPLTEPGAAWSPSPQYAKVAEANRQFYAKNARF
jgi:hypothetical protein